MKVAHAGLAALAVLSSAGCSSDADSDDNNATTTIAWNAALVVQSAETQTVGASTFSSSSVLDVSWATPAATVDHYEITGTEQNGTHTVTVTAASGATQTSLVGLKAGTTYDVGIKACTSSCAAATTAGSAAGSTAEEYWQLQGSGDSYGNATKVVSPSSTLSYAIRLGAGSGAEGRTQFYYNPGGAASWPGGSRIAVNSTTGTDLASLKAFTALDSGLKNACPEPNDASSCFGDGTYSILATQAVPLTSVATMRLYFEATDINSSAKTTRMYYLDSYDGYLGRDFNKNASSSICAGSETSNDYRTGGDCEFTVAIGIDSDAVAGGSGLTNARQSKIAFPQRDTWLWDDTGATPSFMIITGSDSCGVTTNGLFVATWSGTAWVVEKQSGCAAPLVAAAHGPVPVHLAAARYKLYYEDETDGHNEKPLRLIFADGANTADADTVDFADWEDPDAARDVHFLWPDGSLLNANEESGLGDHMILVPDDDLAVQFMYLNLGGFDNSDWAAASGGLGIAVLLNP